ncbi:P-loop NTPase fold protein [Caulobacter endophyticus]|nr:P-loop NTPase fold protein [Caulobacter endophyticus]
MAQAPDELFTAPPLSKASEPEPPSPQTPPVEEPFDPIEPAQGKSIQLGSLLAWRSQDGTPYVASSVVAALLIALDIQAGRSSADASSSAGGVIDAQALLVAIQVLGRRSRFSRWSTHFQNAVLRQDVVPADMDAPALNGIVERAQAHGGEPVDGILQWDAVEVLAEASRLRRATNATESEIGVRHITAAYFLTQAGHAALRAQGFLEQYGELRGRMAAAMSEILADYLGDDIKSWEPFIEQIAKAPPKVRLKATEVRPDYSSDTVDLSGGDPLDAARDARALADVILLKAARPPLALGVFGPWGSGKSTLVRRLQSEIRQQLEAERAQPSGAGELGRVRNAIQIEFSAWSFADSENLWAALTAEVFDQLAAGGIDGWRGKPRADLVGSIAARLSHEAATLNTSSAKAAEHEKAVERLQASLDEARKQKAKAGQKALVGVLGDLLAAAGTKAKDDKEKDEPEKEPLQRLQQALLDAPDGDGVKGEAGTLKALGVVWRERLKLTWRSAGVFMQGGFYATVVVFVVLSAVVIFTQASFGPVLVAWLVSIAGSIFLAAPYLAASFRLLSQYLAQRAKLSQEAAKAEGEATAALALVQGELAQARSKADASRAFVDTFRHEANAPAAPGLMLKYLLSESEDLALVRKQIGMINSVRRCFEQLAAVIREMRASSDPDAVDRIVIYIDDLDRCSAKQVVAILEAIHLLLAFDCFVVVVAVDPKWLAQSLSDQHQQFVNGQAVASSRATPEDYLEKIFQLALHVRPLAERDPSAASRYGAYKRFAASLLEPDRAQQAETPAAAPPPAPVDAPPVGRIDLRKGFTIASPDRPKDFDAVRLERVSLGQDETQLLLDLGVLAAKSPRAVKRMVNVYRLIRISHADRLEDFLKKTGGEGPSYWAVLLALAYEIGLPATLMVQLSTVGHAASDDNWQALLDALDASADEDPVLKLPVVCRELFKNLQAAGLDGAFAEAWKVVLNHLGRPPQREELLDALAVVSRYSFRSLNA